VTFEEVLTQTVAMLQRLGRVSYRALKRQFDLDDAYLEDLKEAILYVYPTIIDDVGRGLIWPGAVDTLPGPSPAFSPSASQPVPQEASPPPSDASPRDLHSPYAERRQLTVLFCDLVDSTRLDRLAAVKVVAQLGAAIGRTFPYELIQVVAQLDAATLHGALAQLVETEVVAQRGLPPQATYTFKHTLIQDAAYQSLLRSTRQQYHQQIAQVLEGQFADIRKTQPELLAHHYTEAGLSDHAMPYWQRAGQRALARSGYREAVACFEQALVALRRLPERQDTLEQAIDLRFDLRNALVPLGEQAPISAISTSTKGMSSGASLCSNRALNSARPGIF
jgi:hypothetical protein